MAYASFPPYATGGNVKKLAEGNVLSALESALTHPTHSDNFVDQYDAVLISGLIPGVAQVNAEASGDAIAVDISGVYVLPVVPQDGDGNSDVANGQDIYIDASTAVLSKNKDGIYFGKALVNATVSGGSTAVNMPVLLGHATPDDRDAHTEVATGTYTLTGYGVTTIDSSAAAVTGTLGDGDRIGRLKTIVMTNADNSSTVSITNHVTSDPEVATFDAIDETLLLLWTGTEWATVHASATFV